VIATLTGVLEDGSGSTVAQTVQDLQLPEGEHAEYTITVKGRNGTAFNLTGYALFMCARKGTQTPLFNRTGTILVAASGTAKFTITSADTDGKKGIYRYDVYIVEVATSKAYRVVPDSELEVVDARFDVDDDAEGPGPSIALIGIPSPSPSDVGKALILTDDSPATVEYGDAPTEDHATEHVTGGGDVIPNAVAAGASGLMTGADKTKLDGIEALADVTDDANVRAALAAASADIAVNSRKITSLADPSSAQDAATKNYADGVRSVTSTATIVAGALLKVSGENTFDHLGVSDSPQLCVGVAVTGRTGAGSFTAKIAQATTMASDGTDTIANGAPVIPSDTVAGRVMEGTTDDVGIVGINVGATVAATLNASVSVIS